MLVVIAIPNGIIFDSQKRQTTAIMLSTATSKENQNVVQNKLFQLFPDVIDKYTNQFAENKQLVTQNFIDDNIINHTIQFNGKTSMFIFITPHK